MSRGKKAPSYGGGSVPDVISTLIPVDTSQLVSRQAETEDDGAYQSGLVFRSSIRYSRSAMLTSLGKAGKQRGTAVEVERTHPVASKYISGFVRHARGQNQESASNTLKRTHAYLLLGSLGLLGLPRLGCSCPSCGLDRHARGRCTGDGPPLPPPCTDASGHGSPSCVVHLLHLRLIPPRNLLVVKLSLLRGGRRGGAERGIGLKKRPIRRILEEIAHGVRRRTRRIQRKLEENCARSEERHEGTAAAVAVDSVKG